MQFDILSRRTQRHFRIQLYTGHLLHPDSVKQILFIKHFKDVGLWAACLIIR